MLQNKYALENKLIYNAKTHARHFLKFYNSDFLDIFHSIPKNIILLWVKSNLTVTHTGFHRTHYKKNQTSTSIILIQHTNGTDFLVQY